MFGYGSSKRQAHSISIADCRSLNDTRPVVSILTLAASNQSDSRGIARRLAGEGVRVTDRPARGAHAFVINTCSVTHVADRKARHMVRLARRLSPTAQVVLTGCYAETAQADIGEITGADMVLANAQKPLIADRLLERLAARGDPAGGCPTPIRDALRTRAFVKIQEGCNSSAPSASSPTPAAASQCPHRSGGRAGAGARGGRCR
jgi:threonylcarbamoyladenosine tRNA methylthiotransferase MtaB